MDQMFLIMSSVLLLLDLRSLVILIITVKIQSMLLLEIPTLWPVMVLLVLVIFILNLVWQTQDLVELFGEIAGLHLLKISSSLILKIQIQLTLLQPGGLVKILLVEMEVLYSLLLVLVLKKSMETFTCSTE